MVQESCKSEMCILQAHSLRSLIEQVNTINNSDSNKILKEDIVRLLKEEDTFFLLYYR